MKKILLIGIFSVSTFVSSNQLPSIDYVFVSFDLFIHGSWDGNFNGFNENDKADKWTIEFHPDMNLFKDPSSDHFTTTFSNSPCWPNYCLRQSYPEAFPFDNNPKIT